MTTQSLRQARVERADLADHILRPLALRTVAGVAAASGGYFATSWGWMALLVAWVVFAAALLGRAQLGRLGFAWTVALLALAGWVWPSTISAAPGLAALAGQRKLIYVAAVPAALLLVRRRDLAVLLGGLVAGATGGCAYGLATRLEPERVGSFGAEAGYRLFQPLGYWNALGEVPALTPLSAWAAV